MEIYDARGRGGYLPVQGPELPADLERARQGALQFPYDPRAVKHYRDALEAERARQAYNRKLVEDAVAMRKRQLYRQYMEDVDPAVGIGWSPKKAERLDDELERQAYDEVFGNFDEPGGDEMRAYYKHAPWRRW